MNATISLDSTVVVTTEQVSCDLAGEAVILNLKDSVYYGLNEVGATIWHFIQQPRRVTEVRDQLMREFSVDSDVCERDLLALLERLAERGLVNIQGETV